MLTDVKLQQAPSGKLKECNLAPVQVLALGFVFNRERSERSELTSVGILQYR